MSADSPEDVDHQFGERLNAGDLDGLMALYDPEASYVPQEGAALIGHAEIREELAGLLALRPEIAMNVVRVVPCGPDVVVLYNDWELTVALGPDGAPVEVSGKAVEIVRRQADGSWQFLCDAPFMRG